MVAMLSGASITITRMPISFINKGVTGRWADVLTAEESSHYEQIAVSQLGPECAQWLATGEITAH